MKKIIEKVFKRITQVISNANNLISKLNFVLAKTVANQSTDGHLSCLYLANRVFNLVLDWFVEIYFVDRVLRNNWVQQVIWVETTAAHTLLIF